MDEMIKENEPLSWPAWIGGFLLALIFGCIGNVVAGLLAMESGSHSAGLLLGLVPGSLILLIAIVLRWRSRGFSIGLFTGACVVVLVGGLCGWAMVGQRIAG